MIKFFFIIIFLSLTFVSDSFSRELSIEQIEERKKADIEREKKRKERGTKKFSTEIILSTEIIFLTKERIVPPTLSNLDPILNDEGFYGIKLGIEDNLTTGRFLGHDYKVKFIQVALDEDLKSEFLKLVEEGYKYFILDLNTDEILELSKINNTQEILFFNVRSMDNKLRNNECKSNILHIAPSHNMLADALTQYLVKKNWKKWFLVTGPDKNDKLFSNALKKSAKKFKIKIKEERVWNFTSDLRRTAQKEVPKFTKGVKYDVLVVSDLKGEFGEYLLFRTWDSKIVVGTQGLVPTSWHRTHEQWGATQMQNRFRRNSGRWMTPVDYSAWVAVRSIGEAVTRLKNNEVEKIRNFLLSKKFGIGAYKGLKVSYRKWNGQLRQPILIASARSMVSVSPQEGFLHPTSELDTLGYDEPESSCKFQ